MESSAQHTNEFEASAAQPVHHVGVPICFTGYADDFAQGIGAIEFSLDGGASWTSYSTAGAIPDKGVNWRFDYTPQKPGRYLLQARAVDTQGTPSLIVSGYAFEVMAPGPECFGSFCLRPVGGGPLHGAKLFRSCELADMAPDEAVFLVHHLGIRSVYDLRTPSEVAAHPEPYLIGAKTVAFEPSKEHRRKDSDRRLIAGVIGSYGAPEERMLRNYRKYAREYPLLGVALRAIASEGAPALVHCVNGKDRTGVLCAVMLRAAGWHDDDVFADYLATNQIHAQRIQEEFELLGAGMTEDEQAILRSFIEARPSYLHAFFDEAELCFGSFENYLSESLHLEPDHRERIAELLAR